MQVNKHFFIVRISKELQKKKRSKITTSTMGYLGVNYSDDENKKGFLVRETQEGSPARNAGFKYGDIITAINGIKVDSYTTLISVVMRYKPFTTIAISYINSFTIDDSISTKEVTLAERPLELDIPSSNQDMRFNLQFGEIVMIGTEAAKNFPEASIGDNLLIHHSVEYKTRDEGDKNWNDWHLMEEDEQYEYRYVHSTKEVLGVWKPKEEDPAKMIVPYPGYIFCNGGFAKSGFQMINGIWQPDAWDMSMEDIITRLEDLKAQIEEHNTSTVMKQKDNEANYRKKEYLKKQIDEIAKERARLTRKMHQKRLVEINVVYVNQKTNDEYLVELEPGDKLVIDYFILYPLDIMGVHYILARPNYVELYKKANQTDMENQANPFKTYYDRVILIPDAVEKVTEGGIIIPDTVEDKPSSGIVISVGPGKKGEPTQAQEGDYVLFSKFSGTKLEWEGVKYLHMRDEEILTALKERPKQKEQGD